MLQRKMWALAAGLMLLSLIVAACAPQVQTIEVTVPPVKETVVQVEVQTQVAVQTVVVSADTPTPAPSFSTPHPILGDVRVRQGIAYCTNKPEIIASVYPFLSADDQAKLVMDTFIPTSHWAYTKPDAQYPFDVAKGGALFDEAGWKLGDGATFRTDANGNEMQLKFTTTTAAFRQTWAAVFEANMKACGLRILRFHVPSAWWFGDTTGLARRDFELGAFAWVGEADPGGVTLWACDQIPSPENNWNGQNYMGWCNEKASTAIKLANNTLIKDERIKQYAIVQNEYAKDVPAVPLFSRVSTFATNPNLTGFEAAPADDYPTRSAWNWEIPGQDTIIIALSQEPASLFGLVEDAYVEHLAEALVTGRAFDTQNYTYKAIYYKDLPTLENGLTVNADVDVKEGDVVVDADGNVGPLAAGMKVMNAAGETVEYKSGDALKMKQMTVTASFVDGLKWSDGTAITKDDMALYDKIVCDKDSGATSFYTCDRTAKIEYPDDQTSATTYVPGYQPPIYYTGPWAYPSQRVLADGRKLGDVPAKEWATLPEIAECPMGFGPYTLACGDWEKGVSMTFHANENFVFGAPKTPNMVIQFIPDTNQAVAQLQTGEVDALMSETTTGSEQVLKDAEAAGTAKVYIVASPTWEHIDMALFVK